MPTLSENTTNLETILEMANSLPDSVDLTGYATEEYVQNYALSKETGGTVKGELIVTGPVRTATGLCFDSQNDTDGIFFKVYGDNADDSLRVEIYGQTCDEPVRLRGLRSPLLDHDAANKEYVDTKSIKGFPYEFIDASTTLEHSISYVLVEPTEDVVTLTLNIDTGSDYDIEWSVTVFQADTAYTVALPEIYWGLGIAPTFEANTITQCRLYYILNVLCGEWVAITL